MQLRTFRKFCCPVFVLLLTACGWEQDTLRFHILSPHDVDGDALREIFAQQAAIDVSLARSRPGQSALRALIDGEADLALVNRSRPFTPGVRAIMPVHKSVLHLLAREDVAADSDVRSLRGKRIYIANNSLAGRTLLQLLAERQLLEPADYQLLERLDADRPDIIIYFGPIDPANAIWKGRGFRLINAAVDTDEDSLLSRTGLSYLVPGMDVMEIPARTYPIPGNETGVLTVGVDTLLVTRKELPENQVYRLAKTLFEHKPRFTALSPSLFSAITTDFDPLDLNFPLHAGARRYLERNEPSFLERYAEMINMLVYIAFLAITGFLAFARWRAQRKKDRIDTFYSRAMDIRDKANGDNATQLRQELRALEREAFESLINEKLAANESFRIFTDLLSRMHAELDRQQGPRPQ